MTLVVTLADALQKTHMALWVNETSGTLDVSESVEKYSRHRDHLSMNKFQNPKLEDFRILTRVLTRIVEEGPGIIQRRSEFY